LAAPAPHTAAARRRRALRALSGCAFGLRELTAWHAVRARGASRLPSPPHSKAAIDAAKLLNLKKFSMSSNMNMEHDSMVVNRLVSFACASSCGAARGQGAAAAAAVPAAA
jgi:hypothetical protein